MGFFSSLFSPANSEEDQQQKIDRKNFDILKYDGIRAQRMGKAEYAAKCFTEALKIQKDFETMKYLMSACYMLNRHDQALEVLREMLDTGHEPVSTLLTRANLLLTMGRNTEAVADCKQAIGLDSENCFAYYQLAKSELALSNLNEAIDSLTIAIRMNVDFVEGYALRAEMYLNLEKGNEALADVEKVIELNPEDETVYLLRGRIHEALGNTEAASADYQLASELNPFNEEAYLLVGRLMMSQEKYEEAIDLFDDAIEQNEQFAKIYAARAQAKHKTGDWEGALTDEQKLAELSPDEKPDGNHSFDDLYKGNII
jgi:pentatricopeptide repeat protein